MKLKNLLNKKTIIVIGIIFLGLITVLIYQSYALFKTNEKMNFINAKVGSFFKKTPDFKLAVYIDGEKVQTDFPAKNTGYYYEKLECTNSGAAAWDPYNGN